MTRRCNCIGASECLERERGPGGPPSERSEVPLELSTREFQILKYFWQRRGEVVLREDLLQDLWGYTPDNMPSTRTIDNHIVNLRRKLEDDQANPKIILSIRGAGYKFDA